MRKLAFFVLGLIAVIGFAGTADAACAKKKLGAMDYTDSNEYLYQSVSDYRSGNVFECQNSQCAHGMFIFAKTGHVLEGQEIGANKLYHCRTGGDDRWVDYDVNALSDCATEECKIIETTSILDGWYIIDKVQGNDGVPRKTGEQLLVQTETSVCKCKIDIPAEQAKSTKPAAPSTQKSAKPAPTPSAVPAPAADVPAGPYQCDAETLQWVREVLIQYSADAAISALARKIIEFCEINQNRTWTEFDTMVAQLRALIEKYEDNSKSALYDISIKSIKTIYSRIDGTVRGFSGDVSVWKDAEGQFNTSRLVSDSVAGVVLGTAGGLITSSVVKKNQVKSGFEDINCTVGGQVVSGWGDEFNVGIR